MDIQAIPTFVPDRLNLDHSPSLVDVVEDPEAVDPQFPLR